MAKTTARKWEEKSVFVDADIAHLKVEFETLFQIDTRDITPSDLRKLGVIERLVGKVREEVDDIRTGGDKARTDATEIREVFLAS